MSGKVIDYVPLCIVRLSPECRTSPTSEHLYVTYICVFLFFFVCMCVAMPLCTFLHHTSVCACVCVCARWNQLDLAIVLLSVMGITLEEIEISAALPINPTIIRIMRVLRIARGTCEIRTRTRSLTSLIAATLPVNAFSELEY